MTVAVKPLAPPREFLEPSATLSLTMLIFLTALTLASLAVPGYWCWHWPAWLCFGAMVMAQHLAGTVIHDASHNAAHQNRAINALLGHVSAFILSFSFPVFTRVHMQHHAHVNDPKHDPDHFVSTGGPLWLIAVRFLYHEVFFLQRRLWRKYELLEWFLARLVVVAIVVVSLHYHFFSYVLTYWFLPAMVVGLTLGLFFDYLPHRPFQERDRWKNARVYPNSVLNLLIMGQNYHLIHHLWPSIPWYNYEPAYRATKPLLDQKGCYQTLGLLEGKSFWSFLYDVFIGVRLNAHSIPVSPELEASIHVQPD